MSAGAPVALLLDLSTLENAEWVVGWAAQIVVLAQLVRRRLAGVYRCFAALMAVGILRTLGLLLFLPDPSTRAYAWTYVATVPLMSVLQVLVVLEVYSLVLRNHPGIQSLGRWIVTGGLAVALIIVTLTLFPDVSNMDQQHRFLLYASLFDRAVRSVLVVFLAVITAFLVWFPVPLNRNTIVHTFLFGVYFSFTAVLLLLRNAIGLQAVRVLSTANLVVTILCYAAWAILLSPKGEARQVVLGHRWQPGEAERLAERLDTINESLLRPGRK